jgi:hypothetical protein
MTAHLMNRTRGLCAAALIALCLFLSGQARANPEVFQKTLPSTVMIVCTTPDGISLGSGVLVDSDKRLVATAHHVVENSSAIVVFFPLMDKDGDEVTDPKAYFKEIERLGIEGTLVSEAVEKDLAMLRLNRIPKGAEALPLAQTSPKKGQEVHAIGNSGAKDGALWRYCPGKVGNVYPKQWNGEAQEYNAQVVETNIDSNSGDSGGPVVNDKAQLVGITHGYDPKKRGVTIAIEVQEVVKLMQDGSTRRPVPEKADERFEKVMKCMAQKEYAKAKQVLLEIINDHPKNERALNELAWVLNELKEYDDATVVSLYTINLNDKNAVAWKELGYALLMKKDYEYATKALAVAVSLNPKDAGTCEYLAQALDSLGEKELAEAARRKAQEIRDGQPK